MHSMIPFDSHPALSSRRPAFPFDDDFFRSFFDLNGRLGGLCFRVDIREEGDCYYLEAELPGVPQDKIQITADHDTLTISAEQNTEKKNAGTFYSERRCGHASRSFRLDGIDQERISAAYANGVLTVTLPKETPSSPAPQRRIPISANEQ